MRLVITSGPCVTFSLKSSSKQRRRSSRRQHVRVQPTPLRTQQSGSHDVTPPGSPTFSQFHLPGYPHQQCGNLRSVVPLFSRREGTPDTITWLFVCRPLIKISVSQNVGDAIKNEPSTITGSRFVGGNYSRHEQREFTCSAVHYFVKHVLLFRS